MTRVVVFGASGMLGGAVMRQLHRAGLSPIGTFRKLVKRPSQHWAHSYDANDKKLTQFLDGIGDVDYVVNCIGATNKVLHSGVESVRTAIRLNSLFPVELAEQAQKRNFKVIHIATDCVFSGGKGAYVEDDPHDAQDLYGKSKSLGEVEAPNQMIVRCSIVGPELNRQSSLFEWVRHYPPERELPGFVNHFWNGVTVDAFGKLVSGIISRAAFRTGRFHWVPSDIVSKHELVAQILKRIGREDQLLSAVEAKQSINRSLSTNDASYNEELWRLAGFSSVQTIMELVKSMETRHFFEKSEVR